MRAVFYEEFGTPDVLQIGERPMPEFLDDEVLVQVAAAGVNPIDRRLRGGELQAFFTRQWPLIPGWEFSGRIVKIGSAVEGWKEGDEIAGLAFVWNLHHGSYAEYLPVKAVSIARKPDSMSFAAAAALPLASLTAWESLAEYADLKRGQSVLIQAGAGGLGSAAIPIARYLGAKVYTTCRPENADYVRSRGADQVIDYTKTDYFTYIREREPDGLDAVLESLSGDRVLENAIRLVRPGGTVAFMNDEPPDMPEIAQRHINTKFLHHRPDGASLERLLALYENGSLTLPQIEILPLEDAAEAHRRSEAGHTRGKLVLHVQDLPAP